MNTLTDRYIWALVRGLPSGQRADIGREVRAAIDDAVRERTSSGLPEVKAEEQVLTEFGDPSLLAAQYRGRPLTLISPARYPDWWRLMKALLIIVLPILAVVMLVTQVIGGAPFMSVLGTTVLALGDATVHVFFWVTLAFVLVDRMSAPPHKAHIDWEPTLLPAAPLLGGSERITRANMALGVLLPLAGVIIITAQQFVFVFPDGEVAVPLLEPTHWSFWLPCLILILLLTIVLRLIVARYGRWSSPFATAEIALSLLFAVPAVTLLITGTALNPEFTSRLPWEPVAASKGDLIAWTAAALISLGTVMSAVDTVRSVRPRQTDRPIRKRASH